MLLLLRQFVPITFPEDTDFEAGSAAASVNSSLVSYIPGLSSGLQTTLLILLGVGIIISLASCVLSINDGRLSMTPIDMRSAIGAEFLRQLPELALFVGPGMLFVFVRYCFTTVMQLYGCKFPAVALAHSCEVILLSVFFCVLLFLLMILVGMALGIFLSWLTRVFQWNLFAAQTDPLMILGIAVIITVGIGFTASERWSLIHNPNKGLAWLPFVGTVVARGLAGVGRPVTRIQDTWRGVWQMLVIMAGSGALFKLAADGCAPRLAMMPEVRSHGRIRKARAVRRSSLRSLPSMLAKDLHTFFRGGSSFTGIARWSMVWILMVSLFAVVLEGSQPQGLKQYWGSSSGMRIGEFGLLLFLAFGNVLPFILFYLILAEQRAVLLIHTVPAHLWRFVWDKQLAALSLGGAGIVLWELCFARSPFRPWSPLLLFIILWDQLIWMSALSCLLVPLFVRWDAQKGIARSIYATPLMLVVVYVILVGGIRRLPGVSNSAFLLSAGAALWPAVCSLLLGLAVLRFVAVPISAFVLGRRLDQRTVAQEEQES